MAENLKCGLAVKIEKSLDANTGTATTRLNIPCSDQICFARRLADGKPFDRPCLELIRTVFAEQHPDGELSISGAQFGSCERAVKN